MPSLILKGSLAARSQGEQRGALVPLGDTHDNLGTVGRARFICSHLSRSLQAIHMNKGGQHEIRNSTTRQ